MSQREISGPGCGSQGSRRRFLAASTSAVLGMAVPAMAGSRAGGEGCSRLPRPQVEPRAIDATETLIQEHLPWAVGLGFRLREQHAERLPCIEAELWRLVRRHGAELRVGYCTVTEPGRNWAMATHSDVPGKVCTTIHWGAHTATQRIQALAFGIMSHYHTQEGRGPWPQVAEREEGARPMVTPEQDRFNNGMRVGFFMGLGRGNAILHRPGGHFADPASARRYGKALGRLCHGAADPEALLLTELEGTVKVDRGEMDVETVWPIPHRGVMEADCPSMTGPAIGVIARALACWCEPEGLPLLDVEEWTAPRAAAFVGGWYEGLGGYDAPRLAEWLQQRGELCICPADGTAMKTKCGDRLRVFHMSDSDSPAELVDALRWGWSDTELQALWQKMCATLAA